MIGRIPLRGGAPVGAPPLVQWMSEIEKFGRVGRRGLVESPAKAAASSYVPVKAGCPMTTPSLLHQMAAA